GANKDYASKDGVLFNKAFTELVAYPAGKQSASYTAPPTVSGIEAWAFSGCGKLSSISLSAKLSSIGDGAFWRCGGLSSLSLPEGLTSIGGGAFAGCPSLASVTLLAQNPPKLGGDVVFPYDTRILVPATSLDAYKRAPGWEDYGEQLEAMR
ncbi:MAG: leucine-rich repeat domain-containing protein, partial [Spirochaetaceae bacterium]|nr:leucine-rich repeat domain-containing protein [Spirochaetaceae bacterium]